MPYNPPQMMPFPIQRTRTPNDIINGLLSNMGGSVMTTTNVMVVIRDN
jgi:hypothetical protein